MDADRDSTPLEERVMRSLEERGLLRAQSSSGNGRRWLTPSLLAAAVALLLVGGVLGVALAPKMTPTSGREARRALADDAPRFALLLYDEAADAGVTEMTSWALALRDRGHYITGEKLAPDRTLVGVGGAGGVGIGEAPLTGFFVVSAVDASEAESIARSSPHVRHGGRIVVRPIERT